MIEQKLYLKNGFLFANGFERVVHGGRGYYYISLNELLNFKDPEELF